MIAQFSIPKTDYYKSFSAEIDVMGSSYRFRSLTNPCGWYYNGSTYWVGYSYSATLNQAYVIKTTGSKLGWQKFGTGMPYVEPYSHATPLIFINKNTGYVYLIQNNYHVSYFKVYKSNEPEGITNTYLGQFGTNESYLCLISYDGTDCVFQTRTGNNPNGYDQSLLFVDLDDPSSYSEVTITDANYGVTNVRHYPCASWKYGESIYTAWGINKRKDGDVKYYCMQALIAINDDFDNIYKVGLSFSKEISVDGAITNEELDDEYNILGNPEDNTTSISEVRMIQLNDDIFTIHISDEATNTYTISKFNIPTGATSNYVLPVTNIFDDGNYLDNMSYMYYNSEKNKIVITLKLEDESENYGAKYHINPDLTGFELIRNIDTVDALYLGLPINLDKIPRNKRYAMAGRTSPTGTLEYIVTNEK